MEIAQQCEGGWSYVWNMAASSTWLIGLVCVVTLIFHADYRV